MLNGAQGRKRANGILRGVAIALLVVGSVGPGASAGPATFHAAGSVEQVYVTDLPAGAQASLITP